MLPAKTGFGTGNIPELTNDGWVVARPVAFLAGPGNVFPFALAGQAVAFAGFLAEPVCVFPGIVP